MSNIQKKSNGLDQLNWIMKRFNRTREEAIKVMIAHHQDMNFLKETDDTSKSSR